MLCFPEIGRSNAMEALFKSSTDLLFFEIENEFIEFFLFKSQKS